MVDDVLVDAAVSDGDLSQLETDLTQAVHGRTTQTKTEEVTQEDNLPPKLKGKTPAQIAEMYANLESAYGRMANDLGTQRKMTDRLLDLKREVDLGSNGAPPKVEIKSSELLENPTEALERFSKARDLARESENQQRLNEMELRLQAQNRFQQTHPDYTQYVNDDAFKQWVHNSSIRQRAAQAAANGDWQMATDLLSEYKATRPAQSDDSVDDDADVAGRKAAKAAALESGSQGSSGTRKSAKTYKRADLMRLRAEKPDVFFNDDFQREIVLAYHEGRVK